MTKIQGKKMSIRSGWKVSLSLRREVDLRLVPASTPDPAPEPPPLKSLSAHRRGVRGMAHRSFMHRWGMIRGGNGADRLRKSLRQPADWRGSAGTQALSKHPSEQSGNSRTVHLPSRGDLKEPFHRTQVKCKAAFHLLLLTLLLFLGPIYVSGQGTNFNRFQWDSLPDLPVPRQNEVQHGLAGAFSGVHNGALIIAGGANFPDGAPWNGGEKVWWDDIYVLEKGRGGNYQWHIQEEVKLPRPLAYGVSISTEDGLICIGGNNSEGVYRDVFRLRWDPNTKEIRIESLAPLPRPLAFMAGARVGDKIYIAGGEEKNNGGATKNFWALDLSKISGTENAWKELPSWPGPARILGVSAGQGNGTYNSFYLFSGRKTAPGQKTQILNDAYRYDPTQKAWIQLSPIEVDGQSTPVMAAPAIASGANHILVFGGADGKIYTTLEDLDNEIRNTDNPEELEALRERKIDILETHPGFSRDVLAYHTITDTWAKIDSMPEAGPVTTNAVRWEGAIVIPSGEVRPGVRTTGIMEATTQQEAAFGWINFSVIGVYLLLLIGMGIFFSRRENTTDDYFKAGGRIPWWAAGISIFGTQLSAITFMAIPAKTYATDWGYFIFQMCIVLVAPIIIYKFLPFFRRLNITTAYEYLEARFNVATRLIGSLMFTILQFGRIGIVLFLPSLALSVVTGVDVSTCILVMGVLSIIYTVLGGIEAVIWTDVIQVVVLLTGALLCLIIIPFEVQGGLPHILEMVASEGKINIFDFNYDLTTTTFWVVLLGGLGANMISYGSDQSVIQRYLTTSDEKSAAQGIWTNALLSIPATLLFFSVGTALFVFYKDNPAMLNTSVNNADAIFPLFIVTQLPDGIAGLLIAGIFAAAMSSLDSSMNSVASTVTTDFFKRFNPGTSDRSSLRVAKWTTGIVGITGTAFALVMAGWDIQSLWDQLFTFVGLFAGGLGGIFILGIFTRRTNGTGAVIGLVASGIVQFLVKSYTPLHLFLYSFTGMASCILIGYLSSLVFPGSADKTDDLSSAPTKKEIYFD